MDLAKQNMNIVSNPNNDPGLLINIWKCNLYLGAKISFASINIIINISLKIIVIVIIIIVVLVVVVVVVIDIFIIVIIILY